MKKHIALVLDIAPVFGIVILVCLLASVFFGHANAEETTSKLVLRIEKHIAENQETINETRDAHIQFMSAKDDNEYQVRRLHDLCYDFDWSTGKVAKIDDCTPEDPLE